MNELLEDFQPLPQTEVHVWSGSLAVTISELRNLEALLSKEEHARKRRFKVQPDRDRFIARRGMLRRLLARYTGVAPPDLQYIIAPNGKPRLSPVNERTGLEFNLSHSNDIVLFAFSRDRAIGVDVETLRPELEIEVVASQFFTANEARTIMSLPSDQRLHAFTVCWTRKEAYLKARGDGIGFGMDRFEVSLMPDASAMLLETPFDPAEISRWTYLPIAVPTGCLGACAVRDEEGEALILRQFTLP